MGIEVCTYLLYLDEVQKLRKFKMSSDADVLDKYKWQGVMYFDLPVLKFVECIFPIKEICPSSVYAYRQNNK